MLEPRPSVTRFVMAVAHAERVRDGGDDSDVAQRIMTRLSEELRRLIGPAGLDVLLARALVLARQGHPALARITAGPDGTLAGLDHAAHRDVALQESVLVIVSHYIELLVTLIGEDLAMSLVRKGWPVMAEEEEK